MPQGLTQDEVKALLKEALKEWLDGQFARFGRWSATAVGALLLSGAVYTAVRTGMLLNR